MLGRLVLLVAIVAVLSGVGGCKKDSSNPAGPPAPGPAPAASVTVSIANFAFSPASLTIAKGTTVTWKNADTAPHTATSDNGAFDTGSLAKDASGSVTFNNAGTFPYHCAVHTHMTATIVVQ